ncbi:MAG: hypothetical protein NC517_08840 [Firmicutes bacterium]|nr:hypothetical protein [Bacillota bacterium]
MSKKKMKKRIKKLEKQVCTLKRDLALFSTRSETTASRTAFYELELEKVMELLVEAKEDPKHPCNKRQERESKMR